MKKEPIDFDVQAAIRTLSGMSEPLLLWFSEHARVLPWRDDPAPYRVWVSEIMLQQTRVAAVLPYFLRFMDALPDIRALASAEDDKLMLLWQGLGYYSRARNLKKTAQALVESKMDDLPADYHALLKLPGIGEYTAGAIASIAFGIRVPAVDGNVLRVVSRILCCELDILDVRVKRAFSEVLRQVMPEGRPGDFNQALMELGATVCPPNGRPDCARCPINTLCGANAAGTQQLFPVKAQKAPRRIETRTVCVFMFGEEVLLFKRPKTGLLADLWEFYNIEGKLTGKEIQAMLDEMGCNVLSVQTLGPATHIFTHIEWHMQGYLIRLAQKEAVEGGHWAPRAKLQTEYAFPSAYKAYTAALLQE